MNTISRLSLCIAILTLTCLSQIKAVSAYPYPKTEETHVRDVYHGVEVTDPYRWMEEKGSSQFNQWLADQGEFANRVLASIPGRETLKKRIRELAGEELKVKSFQRLGDKLFFLQRSPGESGYSLVQMNRRTEEKQLLIGQEMLRDEKSHQVIDWFKVSPDGGLVVVGVSTGGSEDSVLRIYDIEQERFLDEKISRTGYNDSLTVTWLSDNKHFYYNRTPKGERYRKVRIHLHRLGNDPDNDMAVWGSGVLPDVHILDNQASYFIIQPDSPYVIAKVLSGVSKNRRYYSARLDDLVAGTARWRLLANEEDQWFRVCLHQNDLYVISRKAAAGNKLLKLDLRYPENPPRLILPPGIEVIESGKIARDALYIIAMEAGVDRLIRIPFSSGTPERINLPFSGRIHPYSAVTDTRQDGLTFKLEGWIQAPKIYHYSDREGLTETRIIPDSDIDFSNILVTREEAVSHDGVRVPVTILRHKEVKLNQDNPTILTGYGAYGYAAKPRFDAKRLAWLERGGVYAVAHIRGGGEYGNDWHNAGKKLTKSNTILDYIACAEHLINSGYTNPEQLAGVGRSAGGITIGGAITERPDLFAAANHGVGIADLLRKELTGTGPANIPEYGTVKKKYEFLAMHSVSPYHRINDNVRYPAVIVTAGANDPRVPSWQPGKFAARLQKASVSEKPVLLRVDHNAGHGGSLSLEQEIETLSDIWSFFLWQMGDSAFQVSR